MFRFGGGQKLDLLLTREESGVSNSGFSEKNYASLSFLVKSLMSFSISGKLRCGVGVNFKPSHGRPIFTENLSITAKPEKTHLYVCHTSGPIKHENC